jgi:hypothetical protein
MVRFEHPEKMLNEEVQDGESEEVDSMHHRQITLADGRYMIFYTFGDADDRSENGDDKVGDV